MFPSQESMITWREISYSARSEIFGPSIDNIFSFQGMLAITSRTEIRKTRKPRMLGLWSKEFALPLSCWSNLIQIDLNLTSILASCHAMPCHAMPRLDDFVASSLKQTSRITSYRLELRGEESCVQWVFSVCEILTVLSIRKSNPQSA